MPKYDSWKLKIFLCWSKVVLVVVITKSQTTISYWDNATSMASFSSQRENVDNSLLLPWGQSISLNSCNSLNNLDSQCRHGLMQRYISKREQQFSVSGTCIFGVAKEVLIQNNICCIFTVSKSLFHVNLTF